MSVRIIGAVCVAAALAGCAKSSDEPPEVSANAMASQGYDAYNRGDYRDAVTYFEDALAVAPDNAFAMRGLAASRDSVFYFGDRRPVGRDIEMEKAIYRVSLLGHDAYKRDDLDEAEAQFRAVLDIAPGNRYALKGMDAVRRKVAQRETAAATLHADVTESRTVAVEVASTPVPVRSYEAPAAEVSAAPVTDALEGGAYVSVGSYDSYVISTGAIDPAYLGN